MRHAVHSKQDPQVCAQTADPLVCSPDLRLQEGGCRRRRSEVLLSCTPTQASPELGLKGY